MCQLVFDIPLHAARRAMAAAAFLLHDHILSQTEMVDPSRAPQSPSPHTVLDDGGVDLLVLK